MNYLKIFAGLNVVIALIFWAAGKQDKANWHLLLAVLLATAMNAG